MTKRHEYLAAVLFRDDYLLVVDKPAGVLSVPGRGGDATVADILIATKLVPPDEPFRTVHRLDRGASGVLVFARTLEAQQRLTEQFAGRAVDKTYLAIVNGEIAADDGTIGLAIATNEEGTRAKIDAREGKPSVTHYRTLERLGGFSLVECKPATGRLHQIRVHLAAIGHPLAVDPVYGGRSELLLSEFKRGYRPNRSGEERPLIDRLTLHAQRIRIAHPITAAEIAIESPLPKDFRATLNQMRRL